MGFHAWYCLLCDAFSESVCSGLRFLGTWHIHTYLILAEPLSNDQVRWSDT
jgi:hypothetical protein